MHPLVLASDFEGEVLPLLRRHCIRCHGEKSAEGGIRLDMRTSVFGAGDSDETIVVPGRPANSLLLKRLEDPESGDLMPLDGQPLSSNEIETLREWISAGANWPMELQHDSHWAYEPLRRPEIPRASAAESTNAVDQFILRRLKREGLQLAKPLDRGRLLRRTSLALIGIPPTAEELEQFESDSTEDAFEKAVDRLLQSQRFGERWAVPWLDLARYADSNGFQADQIRDNWAYRDWVIKALNNNMPFDQFVVEQLAGDLLPNATVSQKIATGFHRMTTCNVEAGVDPEANRVNQVVDRVNTTATVFMGTTLECAQCHDHKYDPFTQRDYYQLFAYFNNTPLEVKNTSGVTWDFFGPTMDLPLSKEAEKNRTTISNKLQIAQEELENLRSNSESAFLAWTKTLAARPSEEELWNVFEHFGFTSTGKEKHSLQKDGSLLLTGPIPDKADYTFEIALNKLASDDPITAIRIDVLTHKSIAEKGPGRGDRPNIILNEITCEVRTGEKAEPVEFLAANADFSQKNWDVSNAIDGKQKTGWAISPQFGKPHWATFSFKEPIQVDQLRGSDSKLRIRLEQNYGRGRVIGRPKLSFSAFDAQFIGVDSKLTKLAKSSLKKKLNQKQREQLLTAFEANNEAVLSLKTQIKKLETDLAQVAPETTLVMVESSERRDTFVMLRGDYESTADKVEAAVPGLFDNPTSIEKSGDRLELARWLTSESNPLLARVTVNRWWAEIFGNGLVNTPEDFGTQSESPSHPELLDWLASELVDSGWSMKHVLKCMVMSQSFGQSAAASADLFAKDPNNRLLARGPRFRLPAETIRDNALAISGLLSDTMYGEPIMPYQPENIWRSVGRNQPKWLSAENADRFRRGVYVVCKRAAPYPSFINFDAPNRGACTVKRDRTNTPLQALNLLNDPAFAEMALAFADRILSQPLKTDRQRIEYAMRIALSRPATSFETYQLEQLLDDERENLKAEDVEQRVSVPFPAMQLGSGKKRELAAWFSVANVILNLDETMSQ